MEKKIRKTRARRLSRFLKSKNRIPYDYFYYVEYWGVNIERDGLGYLAYLRDVGGYRRYSDCAFQLARLVFNDLFGWSGLSVQSQVSHISNMSNPLSKAIVDKLNVLGVSMEPIGGFRHSRPQIMKPIEEVDVDIKKYFDQLEIPAPIRENMQQYVHSSHVEDMSKRVGGYVTLCEKPFVDADFDTFLELLIDTAIRSPSFETLETAENIDEVNMLDQVQNNSSAGLLNLNTTFGSANGTKNEMHAAAVNINIIDGKKKFMPPGAKPFKPVHKDQVQGVDKKIRTIMVESQANTIVLRHFFNAQVVVEKDAADGNAIGLSTLNGDFKIIVMSWYYIWLKYNDGDFNVFCDWLSEQTINESDKKHWESSTNANDGIVFVMHLLSTLDLGQLNDSSKTLLTRALADYINPAIQIDGNRVFFAPWRIPSGSYLTSLGNTRRHRMMNDWVVSYLENHGGYGREGCLCAVCARFGVGPRVGHMEIELLRMAFICGDDYISVCREPQRFNDIMDFKFGTETKTEIKKFFSELNFCDGAEFLKKHFYLERNLGNVYNIRTFREPSRVLAKLRFGRAAVSKDTFYAAVISAIWDSGYNTWLQDLLYNMATWLGEKYPTVHEHFAENAQKYKKRNFLCDIVNYVPTIYDVVNMDSTLLKPAMRVVYHNAARNADSLTAWYKDL